MTDTAMSSMPSPKMARPLAGIRVLDLTMALSGPYCTLLLAGMGAEVIKIEGPKSADLARTNPPFFGPNGFHLGAMQPGDVSVSALNRHRNKKSITLDLKSPEGRALFMRLAQASDVVVENMSEGTAARLGVGYEAVRVANSRIVYASISGLGDPSPMPGVKAMDIIVQAASGVMDVTGATDGPPTRFGLPIADLMAPLYAISGILAAVIQRGATGTGQHVKVGMLDCMASLLPIEHFDVFQRAGYPSRSGNQHTRLTPFGIYATQDGHVAIAATADGWTRALFATMGRPDLLDDPRFKDRGGRVVNADALNTIIEAWTRTQGAQYVEDMFGKAGIPCARVRTAAEVMTDPWLRKKGAIQQLAHPRLGPIDAVGAGIPIEFSEADARLDEPAHELGADNADVYRELLGLSDAELQALKAKGIV